jgi:hypothetical protein
VFFRKKLSTPVRNLEFQDESFGSFGKILNFFVWQRLLSIVFGDSFFDFLSTFSTQKKEEKIGKNATDDPFFVFFVYPPSAREETPTDR